MKKILLYIDGKWTPSSKNKWFDVYNPANGEVVGRAPLADRTDVALATAAAARVQKVWGETNPFYRSALLRKASENVLAHEDEIAAIMTAEQGKTLDEAKQEVRKGADIFRFYAEEGERVLGRIIPNADGCVSNVIYQPVGVAGAITPWNYPVELLAWKLGGALAAGCTIVCKLPYETPLSPMMFVEQLIATGLPDGVVQVLTGRGSEIGTAMALDPNIDRIAFTGSTKVGKQLAVQCAESLKHVSLELGGSLPMIVCEDCDLDEAVKGCVRRSFRNNGQICIAINRVYVHRSIYEAFLQRLAEKTSALKIGDAAKGQVDMGPMCTKASLEKVIEHVEDARSKGARILTGGKQPEGEAFAKGYFYEPTVIADATKDMLVMSEETFGPAIGIAPFDTLDEAIALANDSPYGLAAICYTKDLSTVDRVARSVDAGNIAFNNVDAGVINAPYGGWKDSGIGCEHSTEGLYEYLREKHVRIRFS